MAKIKNPKIQVLRALAIIAVVMIHTCPAGSTQIYVRPFINFTVALFLFLSGYLTDVSKINIKMFYKKRIVRVIIPYTIWSILYTTLGFIIDNDIDLKRYIINYLTASGAAMLYYIFVYIQFVLLTPLLGKLLEKKFWWLGFVIAPMSLILRYYWLISGTTPNKVVSTIWGVCCLGWFTFYYLGLYLKNKAYNKNYNVKILIILYVISIIVQVIEGYAWYKLGENNCGTQLKLSSLLTSSIFILLSYQYIKNDKYKGNNKLLLLIGNYSFGIYISHCMFIDLFKEYLPFWNYIPFCINSIIVLIVSLIFVMVGSKCFGKRVSRYFGFC